MPGASVQNGIDARLSRDAMSARLAIAANAAPELVTADACLLELQNLGIQLTKSVKEQVESLVARHAAQPDTPTEIELRGEPPTPGRDGRFDWAPECDPEASRRKAGEEAEQVDFYQQSAFITVSRGQQIGRMIQPAPGEPGTNLCGEPVAPRPGKPCPVTVDPNSVAADADGVCRSLIDGVIHFEHGKLAVRPQLDIAGYVDFDTGNIDFKGDVTINKGVRDLFRVRATGAVCIRQLVEAATIEAGGDLALIGGMAAKQRGRLDVGGNMTARYLDNVVGSVKRDVEVEREIIQCQLDVSGRLLVERGALIGGRARVGGAVRVAELGSRAHLKTELVLATLPEIEQMIQRLQQHISDLQQQREKIEAELMELSRSPNLDQFGQSRLTELMKSGPELDQRIEAVESRLPLLQQRLDSQRGVDLIATKAVHCGTVIRVEETEITLHDSIHSALRMFWNRERRLLVAVGDGSAVPANQHPMLRVRRVG